MFGTTTQLLVTLSAYKYALLLPIAIIEGPIITVLSGFLVSLGQLHFLYAYGIIVLGNVIGDHLAYLVGRIGGPPTIERWGHYFGLTVKKVAPFQARIAQHPVRTIILGKFAFSAEVPFLLAAGLAQVQYRTFAVCSLLPTLPKSMLFLLIGFYYGHAYRRINTYFDYAAIGAISLALILTLAYFVFRHMGKKHTATFTQDTDARK